MIIEDNALIQMEGEKEETLKLKMEEINRFQEQVTKIKS